MNLSNNELWTNCDYMKRPATLDFRLGEKTKPSVHQRLHGLHLCLPTQNEYPKPHKYWDLPSCDGSAPEFWYQASYSYVMRNLTGAIQFGTAYGDMSGIYQCASYVCGDDCPNGFDEYYIMEGQGIGELLESAVMYGLLGGGNSRAWNKVLGHRRF